MAKHLLRNIRGHLVNIDAVELITFKQVKGINVWTLWLAASRNYEFYESNQPVEYAFISKWVTAGTVEEQPRNALGQFEKSAPIAIQVNRG